MATLPAGLYANLSADLTQVECEVPFLSDRVIDDARAVRFRPLVASVIPTPTASQKVVFTYVIQPTQVLKNYVVAEMTTDEATAKADRDERDAVKAILGDLDAAITEINAAITQAQTYIDLAAPTNTQRNDEVRNAAIREKNAAQRERRLTRIVRRLLKAL